MLRRTTAYTRYQIYFQDIVNPLHSSNMVTHKPPYILHCYTRLIHVLYVLLSSIGGLTSNCRKSQTGTAKNTAIQMQGPNLEQIWADSWPVVLLVSGVLAQGRKRNVCQIWRKMCHPGNKEEPLMLCSVN